MPNKISQHVLQTEHQETETERERDYVLCMEFHCNLMADIHGTTISCSSFYFMTFMKNDILFLQTVQNPKPALKILAFKVAPEFGNLTVNVLSGKSEKHNKNFT
jgi:hypothetical protein